MNSKIYRTPHPLLQPLELYTKTFPQQALEQVIAQRDEVIPELLNILAHAAKHPDAIRNEPDYMAHIYAMFLLAQFREERSYPLMIELVSAPGDVVYEILNDVVTEDLKRMLASVCGVDIEPIKALIENPKIDDYVRSAGLDSLVVLVAEGVKSREEILAYFQSLFREKLTRDGEFIWSALVTSTMDLYGDGLYGDIQQAFADDLIDTMFVNLDNIDEMLKEGLEKTLKQLHEDPRNHFIENMIDDMKSWAAFQTPVFPKSPKDLTAWAAAQLGVPAHEITTSVQMVRQGPKIGRNEPCPCGSGLKYKRCCGKTGAVSKI